VNSYKLAKKKAHEVEARKRVIARRLRLRAQLKFKRLVEKTRESLQPKPVPVRLSKGPRPMRARNERQLLAGTMNLRMMQYYGLVDISAHGNIVPNNKYAIIRQNILDRQKAEKEKVES
jgi:hypothetical protein